MNLIRWFAGLFSGGGGGSKNGRILPVYVLSRRCNEPIAGQVDLYNELSLDEDETGYFCRKVLHTSGESRCFDQVEVSIWFDNRKNMTEHEVSGGRWLSEAEYEQELVRFHAPPDEEEGDIRPALNAAKMGTGRGRGRGDSSTTHAHTHADDERDAHDSSDSGGSDGGGGDSD